MRKRKGHTPPLSAQRQRENVPLTQCPTKSLRHSQKQRPHPLFMFWQAEQRMSLSGENWPPNPWAEEMAEPVKCGSPGPMEENLAWWHMIIVQTLKNW